APAGRQAVGSGRAFSVCGDGLLPSLQQGAQQESRNAVAGTDAQRPGPDSRRAHLRRFRKGDRVRSRAREEWQDRSSVCGHGTEYIEHMPEFLRARAREQMVRTPKSAEEAREQVRALKQAGVDGLKAILENGWAGKKFNRLDTALLKAIAEEARAQKLPLVVHTSNA